MVAVSLSCRIWRWLCYWMNYNWPRFIFWPLFFTSTSALSRVGISICYERRCLDGLVLFLHECLESQKFSWRFWPKANCLSLSYGLLSSYHYDHLFVGQICVIFSLRHVSLEHRNSIHNLKYYIVSNELCIYVCLSNSSCILSGQTNYDTFMPTASITPIVL